MLHYRINVLQELKRAGYSTYRIRAEKILSEGTMQRLRTGSTAISVESLGILCNILQCQPGDILEWVPEDSNAGSTQSGTVGTADNILK
ncbi:MAG: helix-turn-helix transcriptional regulator [Oscillibacter sp.]|nr:helix-turn-helix transcriptional regulator [Oscillibacter sp.]